MLLKNSQRLFFIVHADKDTVCSYAQKMNLNLANVYRRELRSIERNVDELLLISIEEKWEENCH